ncbi:hypothetical protein SAY86_014284 [Trapa natans]|uniref:RING-type E3 ubiquitin transferase n=1 Tax=Trapa natans TaxID=22666 RepID=A0AAN7KTX2_TRANT|nr:hypothetical protein SAY86_014284 [Trapa natans]
MLHSEKLRIFHFFAVMESTPPQLFPPPPPASSGHDMGYGATPRILLLIIILAAIFFVSGLFHLLVRFLMRPTNIDVEELERTTAFQGRLQQLFHLHDAGVDQSVIDTLPVFYYRAIVGIRDPLDCAVCLCEFEADDKLRLLPRCSHAFHVDCIDTWLLSHSTCPICRSNILHDSTPNIRPSAVVVVLESGSESPREIARESEVVGAPDTSSVSSRVSEPEELVVKLGRFKNIDGGGGGEGCSTESTDVGNGSKVGSRRCFSMGSFEYVMNDTASLQVPMRTLIKNNLSSSKRNGAEMSERHCKSKRHPSVQQQKPSNGNSGSSNNKEEVTRKKDSFSISKIWLRRENQRPDAGASSSRRIF